MALNLQTMVDENRNAKASIIEKADPIETDTVETDSPPTDTVGKAGPPETDIVDSWMTCIAEKTQPLTTFIAGKAQPWTTSIANKANPWKAFMVSKAQPWTTFIVDKTQPWMAFIADKASPWKTRMIEKTGPWITPIADKANRWRDNKAARWVALSAILLLIISFFFGAGGMDMTPMSTYPVGSMCGDPIKTVQPWHIRSFEPRWFGWFGGPAPLTYRTNGPKAHQISFVALDKRNIEVRLLVDNEDRSYRGVEVDNNVNCGDDVGKCLELGFAAAAIVVPAGKHTLSAEIVNGDGAFRWGRERKRRVMWLVQECP